MTPNCTVTDAGANLLVSGPTEAAVLAEILERERLGFRRVAAPARVGSRWLATLARPGNESAGAAECEIERLGLQVVVRGPTEAAVRAAIANLTTGGAKLVGEIAFDRREWSAVLDAPR